MTDMPSEQALVSALRAGSDEAFETLVRLYMPAVCFAWRGGF